MNFSFNYYKKIDNIELYLCNPDGRELHALNAYDRSVSLRFNDISTISFNVPCRLTKSDGTTIDRAEYYDLIEAMRFVYATNIGWFKITSVSENDTGVEKYKSVEAESLQTVFKHKGFVSEERVYKFYNPEDPMDASYDAKLTEAIPSVVGQLYQQLGIAVDLAQGDKDPETPYDEWTITYISPTLIYENEDSICRTFKENMTYGYDWMVNDVEEAFEVVFIFDFLNKAIQIKTVGEATTKANLCLSFNNFMRNIQINESSEDIVTVLSCNGNGIDITQINPTGTNYIVDFSYYMDEANHKWMSEELIEKLKEWGAAVEESRPAYVEKISRLRDAFMTKTQLDVEIEELTLSLNDLNAVRDNRIVSDNTGGGVLTGIVMAEEVETGENSIDEESIFYEADRKFTQDSMIHASKEMPTYDQQYGRWMYPQGSVYATVNEHIANERYYFPDANNYKSYCKLTPKAVINPDTPEAEYVCGGFQRYIARSDEEVLRWIGIKERLVREKEAINEENESLINTIATELDEISSKINILAYFSDTPKLLRELNCYWVEGEYNNENIAELEDTTPEQAIDLAYELLEAGKAELSKVSRPRLSFSIDSIDFLGQYELREQANELVLGKVITIEHEDGIWYYPALLELSFDLDHRDNMSMTFANALRLDDWGYTYADLITSASSTARQVSANWQNIMQYSKDKESITNLIKNPLDSALRASFANMVNQEFVVDDTGILGRKRLGGDSADGFEDEQVRMINNMLVFTDNGWKTSKAALGKVEVGGTVSYGLIAETIVGQMILGENLQIHNENGCVKLDKNGISIIDDFGHTLFEADMYGGLTVSGYATSVTVDNLGAQIGNMSSQMAVLESEISAKVNSKGGDQSFSWELTDEGFYVKSNEIPVLSVTASGLTIDGNVNATSGTIGGGLYKWNIGGGTNGASHIYSGIYNVPITPSAVEASRVYIGTDGLAYRNAGNDVQSYTSVMQSNVIACYGESYGNNLGTAVSMRSEGIYFYWTGRNTLESASGDSQVGSITIEDGDTDVGSGHMWVNSPYIRSCYTLLPNGNGKIDLGSSSNKWKNVYATTGTIQTSDEKEKNSVQDVPDNYSLFFDELNPVIYKLNDGTSDRFHVGFGAREVEQALDCAGLSTKDFAGICISDGSYGLRYGEFVALNTKQIQMLKKRVSELEAIIKELSCGTTD